MSAGTGILHSEKNDSWRLNHSAPHTEPVHFIQMWILPDEQGVSPGYEQQEVSDQQLRAGLVPVASGMDKHNDSAAIRIGNRHAALYAARLGNGESVQCPQAPYVHLFIARGKIELEGSGQLSSGDAVRMTAAGGQRITAVEDAEILIWEMHAGLRLA